MAASTTSLLDLINAGLLSVGTKVMMRDIEGELTEQGTIISSNERGTIEYKTPTAFSKAVTNSTSGGWHQVKLKSSGGTTSLFDIKRKYSGYTKRVRDGTKKRRSNGNSRSRSELDYAPSRRHHVPVVHTSPVYHHRVRVDREERPNLNLPIVVRFRDDDSKRGMIKHVNDDFSAFELEFKGKIFPSVSAVEISRELSREYAEDGTAVSINTNGIDDLKYQTPSGEWGNLRDLLVPETRKRKSSLLNEDDYEEDEMSGSESETSSPPPLTPPSPASIAAPTSQFRNTMIAKHIKHSRSSDTYAPSLDKLPAPSYSNGKHSHSPSNNTYNNNNNNNNNNKRQMKDVELLVYVDNVDSIPYEVLGSVDSYEALSHRISCVVPDFPATQAHELGVYSEYWEKHAGVAYVKPPQNWADFPACTSLLVKKIPDTIIINQYDL